MKKIQIETIAKYTKDEEFLQLIKNIKSAWAVVLVPEYLINNKESINYIHFYVNNNIYTLSLINKYFGKFSLSSDYIPTTNYGSGSNIIDRGTFKDISNRLNALPNNYFIGGWKGPNFYTSLEHFIEKSYFKQLTF
jgi:purine-cytosine permease-like protein